MSATIDPRALCIIGAAQRTWHLTGDDQAPEPLAMQAEICRAAVADCGSTHDILGAVGSLQIVNCMSWPYDDPCARLAEELSITPPHTHYSGLGGTTPQQLINHTAAHFQAGDLDVALMCGAEALDTKRRLKRAGERPAWSHRSPEPPARDPSLSWLPTEVAHEVFQAYLTFAVRDIARRAHRGTEPARHLAEIGALLAPMTDVAAANPHAWFPQRHTADQLMTSTTANRMVSYPYTKHTMAIMDVDMASATLLATHAAADRMGVPVDRRVYLRGWASANDAVSVAEHPELWRSPAMEFTFAEALHMAGVGIDGVAYLDLYSCFASSVSFACDALGLRTDDPRGTTVTGGLPFSGGPASNYLGHSLATMTDRLRSDPDSLGLVSGVGMHMTNHVAAVYSTAPGPSTPPAEEPPPGPLTPAALPIVDSHTGPATIAAYSVLHDRDGDGAAGSALLVCDIDTGARCYARVTDADLLGELEAEEWVGRTVEILAGDRGVNVATAAS